MKNIINMALTGLFLLTVTACEKDLELFNDPICRLNFYYQEIDNTADFKPQYANSSYSFIYKGSDLKRDTVWVIVESMGKLADQDRPITLEQLDTTAIIAQPGVHYVAFDDPSLAKYYVMPADKARTRLPIVILRDASLKQETVVLKYRIKANEFFSNGYDVLQTRSLSITDMLAEPAYWNKGYPMYGSYYSLRNFIGNYGVVKHQFMIDTTGKAWDDDFIEQLITGDSNYLNYIIQKLISELAKTNEEREAQGLDVLKEADGTVVSFDSMYDD